MLMAFTTFNVCFGMLIREGYSVVLACPHRFFPADKNLPSFGPPIIALTAYGSGTGLRCET